MSGGWGPAKRGRPGPGGGGVSQLQELEREEQCLLRLRRLVEEQLKMLQAEAVTIQRMIAAQNKPQDSSSLVPGENERTLESQEKEEAVSSLRVDSQGDYTYLPDLNLDIEALAEQGPSNEELEEESEDSEEEF